MTFRNIQVAVTGDARNLSSTLYRAGNEVDRFHNKVNQGNLKTASTAKLMGVAFAAAGVAVATGLAYAVVKATEFDKSMRNVNSLLLMNEDGFRALSKQVISLSTTLPQSANTLALGLYDIASSGFAGADGLKVLQASAQAASAGLTDTATASAAMTAVLNAYGRTAADAGDVSDVLFSTVNLGVISFGELSGVIGDVVGTAAAASVGIDQVGSAIATMTLTGIGGGEAGTSLNRVLQSIISPSEKLGTLLKSLGYESGAAALKQDGLRGVMEKVRVATGGNITSLLELFPEIRAARGALALMANEGKNYTRVSAGIESAEARRGATLRALHEQMKSISAQWALFKNRIDAAAISGGTKLLPVLLALMGAAGDLGSALSKGAAWAADQLAPTWQALADIGQDLWKIAGQLAEVFGPVALAMAAVVAVPLFATLNLVLGVVSSLTGFLADHKGIVLAVALAYGVMRVQAMLAAAGGIGAAIQNNVLLPMINLLGGIDNVTAGYKRMRIAQAAATLGATAGLAIAVTAWMAYNEVTGQVEEAVKGANDAIANGTPAALAKQRSELAKTRAELEAIIATWDDRSFLGSLLHPSDNAKAAAAINQMDQLDAAITKVDATSFKAKQNVARFLQDSMGSEAFDALLHDGPAFEARMQSVADHAVEGGGRVTGSYRGMKAGLDAYRATHDPAISAEKRLIAAMGEMAGGTEDAQTAVDGLKDSLDKLIGGPLSQEAAMTDWEAAIDGITSSIKENGVSLDANTEKGRNNRKAIAESVAKLKDRIKADADAGVSSDILARRMTHGAERIINTAVAAGMSETAVRRLGRQLGLTPEVIKTMINVATEKAKADLAAIQRDIDNTHGKTVSVGVKTINLGGYQIPTGAYGSKGVLKNDQAHGGFMVESYAAGGTRLPRNATVVKDGSNLVQWAEQGTGGEAFIPLAESRRGRSTEILEQVARIFGMRLESFASGGVRWNPNEFSASGALGSYQSRMDAGAQDRASRRADRTKNPNDTAEDFYRQPFQSLLKMTAVLKASNAALKDWRWDLAKISKGAGGDVAEALRGMGEAGERYVEAMAKGTTKQMRAMAAQFRSMEWQKEYDQVTGDIAGKTKWNANLLALTKAGHADLAAEYAAKGYSATNAMNLQTIVSNPSTIGKVAGLYAQQVALDDPKFAQALALAGVLSKNPGLGINGLSRISGTGVADVVGLLETYWVKVFAPMGKASAGLAKDRALISSGKQPTGLAKGGIVMPGQTGAALYRWAEPESGGEVAIPLGGGARARDLHAFAGRMLGVRPTGGVTVINNYQIRSEVAVRVPSSNATPEQIAAVAKRAVDESMSQLVVKLTSGVGRN